MRRITACSVAALALFATGCGGDDEDAAQTPIDADTTNVETAGEAEGTRIAIAEVGGSGQSGRATLTPGGEGRTLVVVTLDTPGDEARPVHIHHGRCEEVGEGDEPAYELDPVTRNPSETDLDVGLDALLEEPHALTIHGGDGGGGHVACGDLAGPVG